MKQAFSHLVGLSQLVSLWVHVCSFASSLSFWRCVYPSASIADSSDRPRWLHWVLHQTLHVRCVCLCCYCSTSVWWLAGLQCLLLWPFSFHSGDGSGLVVLFVSIWLWLIFLWPFQGCHFPVGSQVFAAYLSSCNVPIRSSVSFCKIRIWTISPLLISIQPLPDEKMPFCGSIGHISKRRPTNVVPSLRNAMITNEFQMKLSRN